MLLVTDLQPGGTPLRIARTSRALRDAGVECVVGCLASRGPVSEQLDRDDFRTFACDAVSSRPFRALAALRQHIRAIQPDLIHATLTHANVAARIVGRQLKIPVVTATATIELDRPWHLRLERWTARCDAAHVVQSETVRAHVIRTLGRDAGRVFVVPPNIERLDPVDRATARRAIGIADEQFLIAWAGRFDPVKRTELIIDIAAHAPAHWRFVLAGDGPLLVSARQRAAAAGIADRVQLPGWLPNLGQLFSAADLLVFPSRTEGVPNALLQAMSLGVPAIVSDIAPHREIAD
ncbi:MAG: glycosyltransferase, partial [Phycisphaerae bacterium]